MNRFRLGDPPPRRVAILRALRLGDMMCAVPTLRALRVALPSSRLVLIGLPWARSFAARFSAYLDDFLEFPGYPGLPERPPDLDTLPEFLARVRRESFDLVLQLHGSGTVTNPLAVLLSARMTAGFYRPGDYCPDPVRFMPDPDRGLEVDRLLSLLAFLGIPPSGNSLEFPILEEDWKRLRELDEEVGPGNREYVCVHPGASTASRRWPPERFAAVADALADRGFRVVLTGSRDDADLTAAVAHRARGPVLDLAGRTSLGMVGALLSRSRLLVCNDTGVSHVADALKVPSVVISTGDNPERWSPRDGDRHRVLCREDGVTPDEVLFEAGTLLAAEVATP